MEFFGRYLGEFALAFGVLIEAAQGPLFQVALRECFFAILDNELERADFEKVARVKRPLDPGLKNFTIDERRMPAVQDR